MNKKTKNVKMMKNSNKILFTGLAAIALSSCSMILPVSVSNNAIGTKTGVSTTMVLFGTVYTNSNYGISDACKQGKITGKTSTVDEKTTNMVFFVKKEMIVTSGD